MLLLPFFGRHVQNGKKTEQFAVHPVALERCNCSRCWHEQMRRKLHKFNLDASHLHRSHYGNVRRVESLDGCHSDDRLRVRGQWPGVTYGRTKNEVGGMLQTKLRTVRGLPSCPAQLTNVPKKRMHNEVRFLAAAIRNCRCEGYEALIGIAFQCFAGAWLPIRNSTTPCALTVAL